MSEVILKDPDLLLPPPSGGDGSDIDTGFKYDTYGNWLARIRIYFEEKKVEVLILHNTPTHYAIPQIIGIKDDVILTPILKCPVCGRKSSYNWDSLYTCFVYPIIESFNKEQFEIYTLTEIPRSDIVELGEERRETK
jgi:hypothetical protein